MSINNIISGSKKYEGYMWLSNSIEPKVYNNEEIDLKLAEGIFVVEGQLYDTGEKKSYSIKYIDGNYFIKSIDISDPFLALGNEEEMVFMSKDNKGKDTTSVVQRKDYFSNRMGDKWLKFLRYWEPKEDENCEGMPVLVITKNVFIGFKK